jgi:hypothetical protein
MSKHVDLIAVAALLLAFALAARIHEVASVHLIGAGVFRVKPPNHFVVAPPRVPPWPHIPRLPRV